MKKIIVFISILFCFIVAHNNFTFAVQSTTINNNKNETTSSGTTQHKIKNWSFGYGFQLFSSKSKKTYSDALKRAGFGSREYSIYSGWEDSSDPKVETVGSRHYFYLERQIKKSVAVGGLYTLFKSSELEGFDLDRDIIINMSDKGNGYYIYALTHSDRAKFLSFQASLGAGASKITYTAKMNDWFPREYSMGIKRTKWCPSAYLSLGIHFTFLDLLIMGSHIHYWYVSPQIIDPITINYYGYVYELPEQKINFGGFSFGITIGLRPF